MAVLEGKVRQEYRILFEVKRAGEWEEDIIDCETLKVAHSVMAHFPFSEVRNIRLESRTVIEGVWGPVR